MYIYVIYVCMYMGDAHLVVIVKLSTTRSRRMGELTSLQKEVVAGLTAGTLTTITVHPLDLVKIRLQLLATSAHQYGYREVAQSIISSSRNSHLLKEAYRGLGINLVGNAIAWGVYFGLYRESKDLIYSWALQDCDQVVKFTDRDGRMSSWMYLGAGASSGLLTAILTNPIWVLKTRIMSTSSHASGSYLSTWDGIKKLLKNEGVRAMWHGLLPSMFGVSQGAIYFMIYDTLKNRFSSVRYREGRDNTSKNSPGLKNTETIAMTTLSKMVSVSAVYPFQLLKSNLQSFQSVTRNYTLQRLANHIYKVEGIGGFYRGLSANLIRSIPSACITFCVYENSKRFF
ncbi:hypothetical protein ZYGR_0AZ02410 [Zygosaccharomyces rouxii]|uniref:Mitochondrial FAD carrier protein FLX1 n=1 Tax=Zygosaccharomyces rouxii TaxID=4956 RepID=A0A1Q3AK04_ZYGRO|nr:hypothetical protein ZYGR_0AZ02410 [Zygosaccharomyces rouxii]